MQHHYTQELVKANIVIPVRVDTSENKSDLLTKALGPTVFPKLAASLVGSIAPPAPRVLMFKAVSSSTNARVPALRVSDASTQCDFDIDLAGSVPSAPVDPHTDLLEAITVISDFHVEMVAVGTGLAIQQNYYERMRVATAQLRFRLGSISALNTIPELSAISSSPRVDLVEGLPAAVARTSIARSPRESLAISRSRQYNEPIAPPSRNDAVAPTGRYCLNCRGRNHDTAQCRHIVAYSDRAHLKRGR